MNALLKPGRFLYGIGILTLGAHQLITQSFRPDILPPFKWANEYAVLPILASVALIFSGTVISGSIRINSMSALRTSRYLAFCFLVLIVTCHLPYILFVSEAKVMQLQVWFAVGEAVAYCGGALVMAGSFPKGVDVQQNAVESMTERLIPAGPAFYSLLIILFGCSHFVYTDYVATMIPKWFGAPLFWTYLVGVLLVCAGIAIILRILVRIVALLLAILLMLFFILFHVPDAIANPTAGGGNEIVRAIVALLFCGIALVIAASRASNVRGN